MSTWTVTGYKSFELGIFKSSDPAVAYIKKALKKEISILLEEGMEWLLISGQLGVECWAAEVFFELRDEYPHAKLAVLTPFLNQEEKWNEENQAYYENILSQADFVESVSKQPYKSPAQFRNKSLLLLNKSDGLLIVYDEEREGSPQYMWKMASDFQKEHPLDVRQITFYDLQTVVEEEQMKENDWW